MRVQRTRASLSHSFSSLLDKYFEFYKFYNLDKSHVHIHIGIPLNANYSSLHTNSRSSPMRAATTKYSENQPNFLGVIFSNAVRNSYQEMHVRGIRAGIYANVAALNLNFREIHRSTHKKIREI